MDNTHRIEPDRGRPEVERRDHTRRAARGTSAPGGEIKLDVRARSYIVAHPLTSAGAALALGALFGVRRRRDRTGLIGLAFAGIGGVALRIARDIAMRRLGETALSWWDDHSDREESTAPGESAEPPDVRPFEYWPG